MSTIKVNTIQTAAGTGSLTVPAETGTVVVKDGSNDVTLNDITAGGIYLGGTGAANYLDDYEEGTWTPTVGEGTVSADGIYIKVGDLVTVWFAIADFSDRSSSSQVTIAGLPFSGIGGQVHGGVFGRYCNEDAQSVYILGAGTSIRLVSVATGDFAYIQHNDLNNSLAAFYIGMTYKAA